MAGPARSVLLLFGFFFVLLKLEEKEFPCEGLSKVVCTWHTDSTFQCVCVCVFFFFFFVVTGSWFMVFILSASYSTIYVSCFRKCLLCLYFVCLWFHIFAC